jgi:tripartite-type tricarboxylate transporter receptor subunit TctC
MSLRSFAAAHFLCAAAIVFGGLQARADAVADFYRGKSVTIVVAERSAADMMNDLYRGKATSTLSSVQEDAPYDLTARNAAAALRKYIPGNPEITVQNMPGANGIRGTEYFANDAPRDGTALLIAAPSIVLGQLLTPSVKYRAEQFSWLGRIVPLSQIGFAAASVKDTKAREVILGAEGPTGSAAMVPWALNRLTGSRFKVVRGYAGNVELFIALERGEIEGLGSVALNTLVERGWLMRVSPLYVISTKRLTAQPNVPALPELAQDESGRQMLGLLASVSDIGIAVALPAGVPDARVASLREAFSSMLKDEGFIAAEQNIGIAVDSLDGKTLEGIVKAMAALPPERAEALKAAIAPQN